MGAYTEYSKMFRDGLLAKAIELHYTNDNLCILEGDITRLKFEHPQIYDNLLSCSHNRDNRTPIEYAQDLVASWIFEDTLVQSLSNGGLRISLAGADRTRVILPTSKVSSSSDALISYKGQCKHLEIMSDYTGYWERVGEIDLRDDKYQRLCRENALFLGVCTKSTKYMLLNFANRLQARFIPQHKPYGYKPAQAIKIDSTAMKKLQVPTLIADLLAKFDAP